MEPDFVKSTCQALYADYKWLEGMKHAVTLDKNKNDNSVQEKDVHLQVFRTEDSLDRVSRSLSCLFCAFWRSVCFGEMGLQVSMVDFMLKEDYFSFYQFHSFIHLFIQTLTYS